MEKLRYKPAEIEAALRHCMTEEQCDGCPLLALGSSEYCGQVMNTEALKYIEILKDLNRTLVQELERRDL